MGREAHFLRLKVQLRINSNLQVYGESEGDSESRILFSMRYFCVLARQKGEINKVGAFYWCFYSSSFIHLRLIVIVSSSHAAPHTHTHESSIDIISVCIFTLIEKGFRVKSLKAIKPLVGWPIEVYIFYCCHPPPHRTHKGNLITNNKFLIPQINFLSLFLQESLSFTRGRVVMGFLSVDLLKRH